MLLVSSSVKMVVWAVFLLSGISLLLLYTLPASPMTNRQQGPLPPPGEEAQLTGTVKEYSSNRNGDVDQLLIGSTGGDVWVHFPPHMARRVMKMAPRSNTVSLLVNSGPQHPPGPASRYQLVQLQAGDAVLSVAGTPPPPPATGKPVEMSGPVDSLVTGNHGEIISLILNDCRVILPPHLAQSIAPLLQQGKVIAVKGYERNGDDGFVNTDGRKLIKPYRLTIDSTDYLL